MQETQFIWMNGKLVGWKDAKIHVLTHALHYGTGAFEGIRCYKTEKGPAIFRLKEHAKRLLDSFSIFKIPCPYTQEQIENAILETVRANKLEEAYIRPILYFGYGEMGLRNIDKASVDFAVAAWPWPKYLAEDAIKVKIAKIRRINKESLKADAKITGHYVNSVLATIEAKEAGCDEALLLDSKGKIAEGPGENIFIIKNKILKTPPLKGQILEGITRLSVIKIAKDMGYKTKEKTIDVSELLDSDEVFMTGTAAEITPIRQVDDKIIGQGNIGELTGKLKAKFLDIVHGKDDKYEEWLSYI